MVVAKLKSILPLAAVAALWGCNTLSDAVSVDPSKLIRLSVSANSIPADGASEVTVTAHISPAATTDKATVTFSTNRGTFVGASDSQAYEVTADVQGIARAQLQSSDTPGTAQIQAVFENVAASATVEFVAVDLAGITAKAAPDSSPGGGRGGNGRGTVTVLE